MLFSEFGGCYRLSERYKDDGSRGVYIQKIGNVKFPPKNGQKSTKNVIKSRKQKNAAHYMK